MKKISVYYKGDKQNLSVQDGAVEGEIFQTLKRLFKITEPISEFFFQDEDGDVVVFPKIIPVDFKVNLVVRIEKIPPPVPQNPNQLPPLTWKSEEPKDVSLGGRRYLVIEDNYVSPGVLSSEVYSKGKLYCVIKFGVESAYNSIGWVRGDYKFPTRKHTIADDSGKENESVQISINFSNQDIVNQTYGILLDMDKREMSFFTVDGKYQPLKLVKRYTGLSPAVRIYAWIKGRGCCHEDGFLILQGSLPIPSKLL